jgi:hypothetical protein
MVEVLHHRLAVAVEMSEDLGIADGARYRLAVLVDEHRRNTKDVAAGSTRVDFLDRVTDAAGNAFIVIPLAPRAIRRKRSTHQRDWVVASFTMAGVLNALLLLHQIYIAEIPGRSVRIRVCGLAPLSVGLFMAVAAILRGRKALGIDELACIGRRVRGQEGMPNPEVVAISCQRLFVVRFASGVGSFALRGCVDRPKQASSACNDGKHQEQPEYPSRIGVQTHA